MHQLFGNVLRVLLGSNPPKLILQARGILNDTLATVMHEMRTCIDTHLSSSHEDLTFIRDMLLNVLLITDPKAIIRVRDHKVNENLRHANVKCRLYVYKQDKKGLKLVVNSTK